MTKSHLLYAVSVAIVLASCVHEEEPTRGDGKNITFSAKSFGTTDKSKGETMFTMSDEAGSPILDVAYSTEDMPMPINFAEDVAEDPSENTKATLITTADGMSAGFGVYVHDGAQYVVDGETVTKNSKGEWTTAASHPFDKDKTYTAIGYYPSDLNFNKESRNFTYAVSMSSTASKDVMIGYFNGKLNEGQAALNFSHAMTAVRFVWGDVEKATKIKLISLNGVYISGTCTPDFTTSPVSYSWGNFGSTPQVVVGSKEINAPSEGTTITDDEYTFVLIPQNLATKNVTLMLTLSDGTNNFSVSKKLTSGEWAPGKINLYKLNYHDDYDYFIEDIPEVVTDYTGSPDGEFTVKSYKQLKTSPYTTSAQAWNVEYYDGSDWVTTKPSGGDWPLVNSISKTSGIGGTSGETASMSFTAQTPEKSGDIPAGYHSIILRARGTKGELDEGDTGLKRYDLSYDNPRYGSKYPNRSTANCYIVGSSGYYKIPAVYGNAIQNGAKNTGAYNPGITSSNPVLSTFVNHDNASITSPWISENVNLNGTAINIDNAVIVWQDAQNLVTGVAVKTIYDAETKKDQKFVVFNVENNDYLKPGNCLIAIRDSNNKILWSWHIWVTDELMSNTFEVVSDRTYHMMPAALGWVYGGTTTATVYYERSVRMRINNGKATKEFTVTQSPYMTAPTTGTGYCPYYQWGRKDPIVPSTGSPNGSNDKNQKQTFNATYSPDFSNAKAMNSSTNNRSVGYSIQHPNEYMGTGNNYSSGGWMWNQGDWCQQKYVNRWSANNTYLDNENGVGTLYDREFVIKTIYDPSPVGFKVANLSAYEGIVSDWEANRNIEWSKGKQGAMYKGSLFLPATGYRGCYWYEEGGIDIFGSLIGYGWGNGGPKYEVHYYTTRAAGERNNKFFYIKSNDDENLDWSDGPPVGISNFFKTIGGVLRPIAETD